MDKYDIKEKEIIKQCKKQRMKYRLLGSTILISSCIICLILVITCNMWYLLIGLAIITSIVPGIIKSKINSLYHYENNQIENLQRMKLEEEMNSSNNIPEYIGSVKKFSQIGLQTPGCRLSSSHRYIIRLCFTMSNMIYFL